MNVTCYKKYFFYFVFVDILFPCVQFSDCIISDNTEWEPNHIEFPRKTPYIFNNFTLKENKKLTIRGYGNLYIKVKNKFIIETNATIDLSGKGETNNNKLIIPTWLQLKGTYNLSNGKNGENGENGKNGTNGVVSGNHAQDETISGRGGQGGIGGQGGAGGQVGGIVFIEANTIINNGIINVSGTNGTAGSDGFDGTAGEDAKDESISAKGGAANGGCGLVNFEHGRFGSDDLAAAGGGGGGKGGKGGGGSGGSGGLIVLKYTEIMSSSTSYNFSNGENSMSGNMEKSDNNCNDSKYREEINKTNYAIGGSGGKNGLNGIDGTDGTDGKDGKDGSIITISVDQIIYQPNIELNAIDFLEDEKVKAWINFKGALKLQNTINWLNIKNVTATFQNDNINYVGLESISYSINNNQKKYSLYSHGNPINEVYKWNNTITVWDNIYYDTFNTGALFSNSVIDLYSLDDGLNYIKINGSSFNLKNHLLVNIPIFIDQYAPCDNPMDSKCTISFYNNNVLIENEAYNNDSFVTSIYANENKGSSFDLNDKNNIKLFILRQENINNNLSFFNLNNKDIILNSYDYLDKNCETNFWGEQPYYEGVLDTTGRININVNLQNQKDGQYWFFTCLRDISNNWSSLIHKNHTQYNLTYWKGIDAQKELAITQPYKSNHQLKSMVYIPNLYKGLLIDKSTSDFLGDINCPNDPCNSQILNPKPAYTELLEDDLKIAYAPIAWTSSQKIKIGVRTPNDISGIKKIYYYIGDNLDNSSFKEVVYRNTLSFEICKDIIRANTEKDALKRIIDNTLIQNSWLDFCFEAEIPNTNHKNIYLWLEDNSGNKNFDTYNASRKLFIDFIPPTKPGKIKFNTNPTKSINPTIHWEPSKDNIKLEKYIVCYWNQQEEFTNTSLSYLPPAHCPDNSVILGKSGFFTIPIDEQDMKSFVVPHSSTLDFGVWNFSIFSKDISGNYSSKSDISSLIITNGISYLDYASEDNHYKKSLVYPESGSNGLYTFKINYFDYEEYAPKYSQIWIDINGNQEYEFNEKYVMSEINNSDNKKYYDGESFIYALKLDYLKSTKGKIKYKFVFANPLAPSLSKNNNIDLTTDQNLILDPYNLNSFSESLQTRNNVIFNTTDPLPVILLKPPKNDKIKIDVKVYNRKGILIKDLIISEYYDPIRHRYINWDLKDLYGNKVETGLYHVVYFNGDTQESSSIAVIK